MKCFSSSTEEIEQKIHVHFNVHFYITLVSIQIGRKPVPGLNILVLRCLKKHTGFFLHSYFSQLDLIEISP